MIGLALLLAAAAPASSAPQAQPVGSTASDGLERTPYLFPFPTASEWLGFLAKGTDETIVESYRRLVPETDYRRWRAGEATVAERIVYRSDGLAIRGILVSPRRPGRFPLIVFNHGGMGEAGRITLADILAFHHLAERGYVVAASALRGEGGSEGQPSIDGGDADDVVRLIALASRLPQVDPTRIGLWGQSRGGLLTYTLLTRLPNIRAAIVYAGPTDLVDAPRRAEFHAHVYPHVIRDYARDPDAALARLSPIRWPARMATATPILLLHGGDDPRVPPSDTLRMAAALQALGRSYRLKIYEGGSHALETDALDVRAEIDRWFDRYLRNGTPPPANGAVPLAG